MRVVSWNVHGFVDRLGRFSPEPALRVLERLAPDVVALQEVEDRSWQQQPALQWLAARGGWLAFAGPTLARGDADYGNVVMARTSAARLARHDLTVPGTEPRGLIDVEFDVDAGRFRLLATHLGLTRRERVQQVDRLLGVLGTADPGRIDVLAGDFNEWVPRSRLLARLNAVFGMRTRGATFPAHRPLFALDRIWVRPASAVINSRIVRLTGGESDHLPVVIELADSGPPSASAE